jgi:predicted nucleic acid-binding Zn ribbon protein
VEDDMPTLTCPVCATGVQQDDLICFTCGANLPRAEGQDEEINTPPTVMQAHLRIDGAFPERRCPNCGTGVADPGDLVCAHCREPLPKGQGKISPVVLRLTFPTGNVDVPAGTSLLLGRDPQESLVAAAFARFENVSRRHATVSVDDAGHATVRDEHSTNGTWVNGDRVLPGVDVRLADGDSLRLAADISADVSLPTQQADPATFSRDTADQN